MNNEHWLLYTSDREHGGKLILGIFSNKYEAYEFYDKTHDENDSYYRIPFVEHWENGNLIIEKYTEELPDYGDLFTIEEFITECKNNMLTDYDGSGSSVRENKMAKDNIKPSRLDEILEDATHIMWFNK